MAEENKSLTPRETANRMLEHMHDDVSYEDIIRQLRILQQIEWVMKDVETAGLPPETALSEDSLDVEDAQLASFGSSIPSLILRSRPVFSWRSLADRSDEDADSFLTKASWMY